MSEGYRLSQRISKAVWTAIYNAFLWLVIPTLIFDELGRYIPSSPLAVGPSFIYAFGISITVLQALGAFSVGMAVSVPLMSGSYLAEAYYIWSAVDGGTIAFSAQGIGIDLLFQPLLFLLMIPSLFAAVKFPLTYLLEQHEAALPSPDVV